MQVYNFWKNVMGMHNKAFKTSQTEMTREEKWRIYVKYLSS